MKNRLLYWYLAATALVMLVFRYLAHSRVADPDTFYHLRVTHLITSFGPLHDFPWNYFTIFRSAYVDHHFLFHLLLSPFLAFGDFLGVDIFLVCQALVFIGVLYYAIAFGNKRNTLLASLLCLMPLLVCPPLLFLLNVGRAQIISVILLLISTMLIAKGRWKLLLLVTLVYTLAYNGFVLILLPLVIYSLAAWLIQGKIPWLVWVAVGGGIVLGTIIHPNFPANVIFYWQHIIRIGIVPIPIPTGRGWLPYTLTGFIRDIAVPALLFIAAGWSVVRNITKYKREIYLLTIGLVALAFGALSFRSQLFVVYFVPFAVVFAGQVLNQSLVEVRISGEFFRTVLLRTWQFVIAVVIVIAMVGGYSYFSIKTAYVWLNNSPAYDLYRGASSWLTTHSQPGTIVFNTQWDQFPQLFYWNQHNYYIVGLDPIFMYEYNPELYWQWRKVSDDQPKPWDSPQAVQQIVKQQFQAKYLFLEHARNPHLESLLNSYPALFTQVYDDPAVALYELQ